MSSLNQRMMILRYIHQIQNNGILSEVIITSAVLEVNEYWAKQVADDVPHIGGRSLSECQLQMKRH